MWFPWIQLNIKKKLAQTRVMADMIYKIWITLLRLLKKEYGNEHHADQSVEEAKTAMQEISSYFVNHNFKKAVSVLFAFS